MLFNMNDPNLVSLVSGFVANSERPLLVCQDLRLGQYLHTNHNIVSLFILPILACSILDISGWLAIALAVKFCYFASSALYL
jgi:hypothetical protein